MHLSVGYSFEPGLIEQLAAFPAVREIYGKMHADLFGGGRSSYTFSRITQKDVKATVKQARALNIKFNYLLNAASLGGLEQTRSGQKKIRRFIDFLDEAGVDHLTVASPFLLKLIKSSYPRFFVRVGVFAMIDTPLKAQQWEDLGADRLSLSVIACNRDLPRLAAIRRSVTCELELIANAGCLLQCAYEPTHMQLLTQSSCTRDPLKGFCLDYCFLHCSSTRLLAPENFIRSTWIRPEDLHHYEALGYHHFKILERSSPAQLILKRVKAYSERSFQGNLLEIVGPVARIKKEQGLSTTGYWRMMLNFFRPFHARIRNMRKIKAYADLLIPHTFSEESAGVYIDNRALDGFFEALLKIGCSGTACGKCCFCRETAERVVRINPEFRESALTLAKDLEQELHSGTFFK